MNIFFPRGKYVGTGTVVRYQYGEVVLGLDPFLRGGTKHFAALTLLAELFVRLLSLFVSFRTLFRDQQLSEGQGAAWGQLIGCMWYS